MAELLFSKIDSSSGNFTGAYEHYKLYIIYRDSIKNKENEKAAIRQQTKLFFNALIAALIYPVHAFFERWVKGRLGGVK